MHEALDCSCSNLVSCRDCDGLLDENTSNDQEVLIAIYIYISTLVKSSATICTGSVAIRCPVGICNFLAEPLAHSGDY